MLGGERPIRLINMSTDTSLNIKHPFMLKLVFKHMSL